MNATRQDVAFVHRGKIVRCALPRPDVTLLDWLREEEGLTGTKEGCNEGDCGACTVVLGRLEEGVLKRRAVNACITFLGQVDGAEVLTVEDVGASHSLHPVQEALARHHGSQCGFCTPGIVMSLYALSEEGRPVTRDIVTERLAGNLCRCTGYRPIIDAAIEACGAGKAVCGKEHSAASVPALAALAGEPPLFAGDAETFFATPRTLAEASALALRNPDAVLLSGASDVALWSTKKLQPLRRIIWLGRVLEMQAIREAADHLYLGAGVSLEEARASLARLDPDLGELMRRFASTQVRNSGTVGGNIANGSPIGDLAPALMILGARLHLRHGDKEREIALGDFFIAYGQQDRRAGELVTGLTIPRLKANEFFRCFKVSKRFDEDISAVMGAFFLRIEAGRFASTRIAYGGMAGVPKRAMSAEACLAGATLTDKAAIAAAEEALAKDFEPLSDLRASNAYRMTVAKALLRRALDEIAGRRGDEDRIIGKRNAPQAMAVQP